MTPYLRISFALVALSFAGSTPTWAVDFTVPALEASEAEGRMQLASPPDSSDPNGQDIGPEIDAAFALSDQFPAERNELAVLAKSLGQDPNAAFTWVRDTIRFDPYSGHLRDSEGVMAAGGGNATDRAVLLKDLLEAMGLKARLAHATLDEAAQAILKAAIFAPRAGAAAPAAAGAFKADFLERIRGRAGRDFAMLSNALGADDFTAMDAAGVTPALPLADHVWVQAEIDGAWVDLDTSLPAATPGQVLATATATSVAVDSAAAQSVTLSVSAVLSTGEQPLLTLKLPAHDAANSQILLYFEPKQDGLAGALAGGGGYLPVFVVNGEVTKGDPITATDDGGIFGSAIDKIDGKQDGALLQAINLKIVTEAPGENPIEVTRVLAAAPPDGAMETDENGIIAMRWIHHVMISNGGQSPRAFAIIKAAAMDYAVRAISTESQLKELNLAQLVWPTTCINAALTTASERLFVAALNRPDTLAFVGRPRVFIVSTGARTGGDGTRQGFDLDLALDGVTIVTQSGSGTARSRFWYGVLQSALETEYGLLRFGTMESDGRDILSASLLIDSAPLTAVSAGVQIESAPAEMKAALVRGARVIVAGVPAAAKVWWTIEADGTSRAVLDPSLGGLTGGGGFGVAGAGYVNASSGVTSYIIDPATGATLGEIRDGRTFVYTKAQRAAARCGGGSEYMTLVGCVAIPVATEISVYAGVVAVVAWGTAIILVARMI